ncbi:hypothetical protein KCU81_g7295, partial [Aureobasidium melanogenum]|uniref:Uncharacterized protein n=1 Tax=Aureobasidium melanogenum (strain CBS 110374) TaxID=1043003 RepID=A0A074WK63_AURM1
MATAMSATLLSPPPQRHPLGILNETACPLGLAWHCEDRRTLTHQRGGPPGDNFTPSFAVVKRSQNGYVIRDVDKIRNLNRDRRRGGFVADQQDTGKPCTRHHYVIYWHYQLNDRLETDG